MDRCHGCRSGGTALTIGGDRLSFGRAGRRGQLHPQTRSRIHAMRGDGDFGQAEKGARKGDRPLKNLSPNPSTHGFTHDCEVSVKRRQTRSTSRNQREFLEMRRSHRDLAPRPGTYHSGRDHRRGLCQRPRRPPQDPSPPQRSLTSSSTAECSRTNVRLPTSNESASTESPPALSGNGG